MLIDQDFLEKNITRYKDFFSNSDFLCNIALKHITSNLFLKKDFTKILCSANTFTLSENGSNKVEYFHSLNNLAEYENDHFDIVINILNTHYINDPVSYLKEIKRVMRENSIFYGCFFGAGTLAELKKIFLQAELKENINPAPHFIPLPSMIDIVNFFASSAFKEPVGLSDSIEVSYNKLTDLFKDLNYMGETNALNEREKKPLSRKVLANVENYYLEKYGEIKVNFELIYLTCFK